MNDTGFVTTAMLLATAVSALLLIAACHSAPKTNAFAATAADRAAEARLAGPRAMAPLRPFDEGFYTPQDDADPL